MTHVEGLCGRPCMLGPLGEAVGVEDGFRDVVVHIACRIAKESLSDLTKTEAFELSKATITPWKPLEARHSSYRFYCVTTVFLEIELVY